jgi:alpha-tubulin suppressor-like RCC1 family protein
MRLFLIAKLAIFLSIFPATTYSQVAAPEFVPSQPGSGVFSPSEGVRQFHVTITCATPGATIRYTLDNATPTTSSPSIASGGTLAIKWNVKLKAKAWLGASESPVSEAIYHFGHAVAAGEKSTHIADYDGRIYAWGKNTQGRLGIGNTANPILSPSPSTGQPLTVVDIAGGYEDGSSPPRAHSILLKEDGSVWTAGSGGNGRLGNGGTSDSSTWVQVKRSASIDLTGIRAVAAGMSSTFALSYDGYVFSWGRNQSDAPRLGSGSSSALDRVYADTVKIAGGTALTNVIAIAAGSDHTLALTADGKVWAWGANDVGQLGIGGSISVSNVATKVKLSSGGADLFGVIAIAAGAKHSVAVLGDGRVMAWGQSAHGRLGNNTTTSTSTPVNFPVYVQNPAGGHFTDAVHAACGHAFTLLLKSNGDLWVTGRNASKQLGDGSTTDRGRPVQVRTGASTFLTGIVDMAAGIGHSVALAADGKVYTWGANDAGELGDGTTSAQPAYAAQRFSNPLLVNQPPAISLAASFSGTAVSPAQVNLNASVTDPNGALSIHIARVDFFQDGVFLGSDTTAPYAWIVSNLAAGSYAFTATVVDTGGLTASSGTTPPEVVVSLPTITVTASPSSIMEQSSTPAKFIFSINKAQPTATEVSYIVSGASTASAGVDYQALSGSVTIPAWSLSAEVDIHPYLDAAPEPSETIIVEPQASSTFHVGGASTITITDSPAPTVTKHSGDNQASPANTFLPLPLKVEVRVGTQSVANKRVLFTVAQGAGKLAATSTGNPPLFDQLEVWTDASGIATAYFKQPLQGAFQSTVSVQGGQAAAISFAALTQSLVAYWPADAGSGTAVADASGAGNHATISNDSHAFWTPGYVGSAVGTNGALYTGQPGLFVQNDSYRVFPATGQPFTIAMWFRANQLEPGKLYCLGSNETYLESGFRLGIDTGLYSAGPPQLQFWTHESGGSLFARSSTTISASRWYHLAATYDGTTARIYLDGELVATSTGTLLGNTNPIRFATGIGGCNVLDGSLDDVRVYHSVLSAAEVAAVRDAITDGDSLPDAWEREHFGDLSQTPGGDPDGDGLTNLGEYNAGSDPNHPDSDGDGLLDGYEVHTSLTDPANPDTDGDGMPDGWELANGLNPLLDDALGDPDFDGLVNREEYLFGTNPFNPDSNGNGFLDGWEFADFDGDGLRNGLDPDPYNPDTDGDGFLDGADFDPLNPAVKLPPPDPGDSTPPVITILRP